MPRFKASRGSPGAAAAILLAGILVLVLSGAGALETRNELIAEKEEVAAAWANVQTVLQRRADLIPALETIAQAATAHERALLTALSHVLRSAADPDRAAGSPRSVREHESAIAGARALIEASPRLSSSAAWETLRMELVGSENRLAIERRRYNEAVRHHRAHLRRFPERLVAIVFGLDAFPEY